MKRNRGKNATRFILPSCYYTLGRSRPDLGMDIQSGGWNIELAAGFDRRRTL